MLIIKVELHSALTGIVTEIARMRIYNDGKGNGNVGHYVGETFIGRKTSTLNNFTVNRKGTVHDWPRKQLHVWNLVEEMLRRMGYGKGGPEGWD